MIKKNKGKVVLSSAIILLPMLFGIILWNDLPDVITTHFGADGVADGSGGKALLVFGIPLILLVSHFVCLLVTMLDKKQRDQTPKALGMIFWILPVISLFINGIMYGVALGGTIHVMLFLPAMLGILFIFMGNYMPKIKQNSTLGIKVFWALSNEENWNKTHRFGGKVMVIGGFILLLSAFLPFNWSLLVIICIIAAIAILPILYSYSIYKRHQKEGIEYTAPSKSKAEKIALRISAVILPLILIGIAILMFTGDINATCNDTAIEIQATYWSDITVEYSEIDTVEYRKNLDIGVRTSGFGSGRLSMGIFQNEEFGSYTLYAYTGATEYVVLTSDEKTLVIGLQDANETQALFETISKNLQAK